MKPNDFSESSKYYDAILGLEEYQKKANFTIERLREHEVKTVLELGCGTGLYLIPIKKAGFEITGLDISTRMLEVLKKKYPKADIVNTDMKSFRLRKSFDAIICMNSSLVLLKNHKEIRLTLNICSKHLNPGGLLILDLPNHSTEIGTTTKRLHHESYSIKGGKLEVIFTDIKKNKKWISEWLGVGIDEKSLFWFKEHYEEFIFEPVKMDRILKEAGFRILEMFGSMYGKRFHPNKSSRRIYVCVKDSRNEKNKEIRKTTKRRTRKIRIKK